MPIDPDRPFVPVRIAVLSVSDSRTVATDTSGAILVERIATSGHELADRQIVADDVQAIRSVLRGWIASAEIDVVITTGGTGLTGRDVTPEAVAPLFDKTIEGFAVVFHQVSMGTVGLSTLQSRACAGVSGGTFIFCLPGSNGAVCDGWDKVLVHQLDRRQRPCNFVEIMPRLLER
jgi:molybdenum cofactor biosynthesis protein B